MRKQSDLSWQEGENVPYGPIVRSPVLVAACPVLGHQYDRLLYGFIVNVSFDKPSSQVRLFAVRGRPI